MLAAQHESYDFTDLIVHKRYKILSPCGHPKRCFQVIRIQTRQNDHAFLRELPMPKRRCHHIVT